MIYLCKAYEQQYQGLHGIYAIDLFCEDDKRQAIMNAIKITKEDLNRMISLYSEDFFNDIEILLHIDKSIYRAIKKLFPLLRELNCDDIEKIINYSQEEFNVLSFYHLIQETQTGDCFEYLYELITEYDNVSEILNTAIHLDAYSIDIFVITEIIFCYPAEQRQDILKLIDWLCVHNFSDYDKIKDIINFLNNYEIIGELNHE